MNTVTNIYLHFITVDRRKRAFLRLKNGHLTYALSFSLILILLVFICGSLDVSFAQNSPQQQSSPLSGQGHRWTPIVYSDGSFDFGSSSSALAVQNHWWILDYWDTYPGSNLPPYMSGEFIAEANTISGLQYGLGWNDAVLYLPLNVAYGSSSTNCVWFQFDIQFANPLLIGSTWWGIWDIRGPGEDSSDYKYTEIGLSYTAGHRYTFNLTASGTNTITFSITDQTTRTSWSKNTWHWTVPNTNLLANESMFSPSSAVEGYTTGISLSGVPFFSTRVGDGITTDRYYTTGSPPAGITTDRIALQYNNLWYWTMLSPGACPIPAINTPPSYPPSITLGQTATIEVVATNNGGAAASQTIAIGFPSGQAISSINIAQTNLTTYHIYNPAEVVSAGYGGTNVSLANYLVQGSANWLTGQRYYLRINVQPSSAGSFIFYVKSLGSARNFPSNWDPKSGVMDGQLEFVYSYTISVQPPSQQVTFYTNPPTGGMSVTFSETGYTNGQSGNYASGDYNATANAPSGYAFHHWEYSGSSGSGVYVPNISANPATVQVRGTGWLRANFSAQITFYINPSSAGSIQYDSITYTNGQNKWEANLPTSVTVLANAPSGYSFAGWAVTGDLSVSTLSSNPATLTVNGPGTLTAIFNQTQANAYLVIRESNNSISYKIYNSATSSWGAWQALPGSTSESPAAAVCGGRLYIVVRGLSGSSFWFGYVNLADSIFHGWTPLDGQTTAAPTLATNGSVVVLVVKGYSSGTMWYRILNTQTQVWGAWRMVPTGSTSDRIAAAMTGNTLHLTVKGASSNLLYKASINTVNYAFSGWTQVAGSSPCAPTLVSTQTGNLYLTIRALDNRISVNKWNGATWEGWNTIVAGATCSSPATAVVGNKLLIDVVGFSSPTLWQNSMDLSSNVFSGWTFVSGSTSSKPTLTC